MLAQTLNQLALALDDRLDWLHQELKRHPSTTDEDGTLRPITYPASLWAYLREQTLECAQAHREVDWDDGRCNMSPATLNQLALALDDRLDWLRQELEHHPSVRAEDGTLRHSSGGGFRYLSRNIQECYEAHREVARLVEGGAA